MFMSIMKYFKYPSMAITSLLLTASPAFASQELTTIDLTRVIGLVHAAFSAVIFAGNYIFITEGLSELGEKRRLLAILPLLFSLNIFGALTNIVIFCLGGVLIDTFFWFALALNSACFAFVTILIIINRKELFAKDENDAK